MTAANRDLPPTPVGVRRIVAAARKLRRTSSDVERKLWHRIRDKQLADFRFRRQRPIGKYIVDFICLEAKLIVELDGGQHAAEIGYDAKRNTFLASLGYRVLRFWNSEVVQNMEGVLERLRSELLCARADPSPTLPLAGEGAGHVSDEIIATTPSPAPRGKVGMGVHAEKSRRRTAAKENK